MSPARSWTLSFDGAAFAAYIDQGTQRGAREFRLTDWEMLMAMHPVGGGMLQLHGMSSIEALLDGGEGYSLLLQSGGRFKRGPINNRQHPNDVLMELSASYSHLVTESFSMSVYAAPIGGPALGPIAYMHRVSARNDPAAPLGHHWQDASHVSYGVVTIAMALRSIEIAGSAFNARESDYEHPWPDFRNAKLDSYSGRASWTTSRVMTAAWWGFISSHDPFEAASPMHRYGGSVSTSLPGVGGGAWSTTAIWGMNLHHHGGASHAVLHGDPNASPHHHSSSLLLETNLDLGARDAVFARAERVMKNGEELGFLGGDLTALYDVRSLSAGYRHVVSQIERAQVGIGGRATVDFVPQSLEATYGTRTPKGVSLYLSLSRASGVGEAGR